MIAAMEYRLLGKSGFSVPVLSLGTGTFGGVGDFFKPWGSTEVKEASRLIDVCLEAGITMFDSADGYSSGRSEEILGTAITRRRNKLLLSTKAALRAGPGPNDVGASRFHLTEAVEASLRRLQTDHIDLFQLHGFDARTPVEETMGTLERPRTGRQDPLRRRIELLRVAHHEVPGRLRPLWMAALRCEPDLLFPPGP